jgi:hypothetical protein
VATVAILDNFIRYVTGTLLLGGVSLGYGVETRLGRVLTVFRRAADDEAGDEAAAPEVAPGAAPGVVS